MDDIVPSWLGNKRRTSFDNNSALLDERSVMNFLLQLGHPQIPNLKNFQNFLKNFQSVGRSVGGDEVMGEWQKREKGNSNSGWI